MKPGSRYLTISASVAAVTLSLVTFAPSSGAMTTMNARASHVVSHAANSKLKTGWIYDGSIADKGYDEEWYNAQVYLQKTLGITSTMSQNTPYTSQWTSTALGMMGQGAKMVVDPGEGGTLFYAACKKYPKVACVEANGTKPFPSNSTAVYSENWQASYLEGMAAGMMTKTGIIGFLEAFANTPAPVMETLNALVLGCQATHPGCRAIATVVNSWYNPPVETEDLNALVNAHADVLATTQNDPSAVTVAEKRHVKAIAMWGDPVSSGRNAFITATDVNYGPTLLKIAKTVANGTYKGGQIDLFGFGSGLSLAPWGPTVSQAVRQKVGAAETQMKQGHNFFCGPIYDNSGVLKVKKGQCLNTMQAYDQWSWFVKGVSVSK